MRYHAPWLRRLPLRLRLQPARRFLTPPFPARAPSHLCFESVVGWSRLDGWTATVWRLSFGRFRRQADAKSFLHFFNLGEFWLARIERKLRCRKGKGHLVEHALMGSSGLYPRRIRTRCHPRRRGGFLSGGAFRRRFVRSWRRWPSRCRSLGSRERQQNRIGTHRASGIAR